MNRRSILTTSVALAALTLGIVALAGPINPPAGPIVSTLKPLSEVEPRIALTAANTPGDANSVFRIAQPGSYYLTGNITGVAAKHGIEIAANNVSIDLMGFNIQGVPGALDGIVVDGTRNFLTVRNGMVTGFPQNGINVRGNLIGKGMLVEQVVVSGNSFVGIFVGYNSVVRDCVVLDSGSDGIHAETGCTITNCSALNNRIGIAAFSGSTVTNCSAFQNTEDGIQMASDSTAANCAALSNTRHGLSIGEGCTVTNCSASFNQANGINTNNNSGCTITLCSVNGNTGDGISAGGGCTVSYCSIQSNHANGVNIGIVGIGGTVADCTFRANTLDGIRCTSGFLIRANTCHGNGNLGDGAAIHATGADNRIEANNCTSADRGIDVDVAGNIIIRNTCSGNTNNWDVVAGNVILVISATPAAAVTGNSGGSAPGSTDPNANFTY